MTGPESMVVGAAPLHRAPVGREQEFLRLQHADGFGPRNISSGGWRLTGPVDLAALRQALDDVVARHEPLRTSLARGEAWHQEVWPPVPARLEARELTGTGRQSRQLAAEEFFNDLEAGTFPPELPLLWAYLGRFDPQDAVLVLVSFLPQVDVWSIGVIMDEIAACYGARVRAEPPGPAPARQYRDYVARQRSGSGATEAAAAYEYWRDRLRGAAPILLAADRGPAGGPGTTQTHRFDLGGRLGGQVVGLARRLRSSPFSVLYAAHLLQLRRRTGATDGVIWTLGPGAGRRHRWTEQMVGYFVNMFPLRTELAGSADFGALVRRVRATALGALAHEVPFIELAEHALGEMAPPPGEGLIRPAFQMAQNPLRRRTTGEFGYAEIRRRWLHQRVSPEIPDDGFLWTMELDRDGGLFGDLRCATDRFDRETLDGLVSEYCELLTTVVDDPAVRLDRL
jgi:hypothetical protein